MPQRIVADPEGGLPGRIQDDGTWVQGVYRVVAIVYGPGEVVDGGDCTTLAELRAKYWDPTRRSLVIPFNGGTYEFGSKLLGQMTDAAVIQIRREFSYPTTDGPPKECACGELSFRHSASYHASTGR